MKIAVLASGGVDSSVALMRLAEEGGHELTAFYLKIWLEDELAFLGSCPWEEDLVFVRQVCAGFAVPLEVVDGIGPGFGLHQPVVHPRFPGVASGPDCTGAAVAASQVGRAASMWR